MQNIKFKKGVSTILNKCCQWTKVFSMHNIGCIKENFIDFKEKDGQTLEQWQDYFSNEISSKKIEDMTNKVWSYLEEIKNNINELDKDDVKEYIEDVLFKKTFNGLNIEIEIIKEISNKYNYEYKFSNHIDEREGIDGFINNIPIQIKPNTYKNTNYWNTNKCYTVYYIINKDNSYTYDFDLKDFLNCKV